MSESTIETYNRLANKYESRWEKYLEHTNENLLYRINIDATDTILDVSGGTGLLVQQIIAANYTFDRYVINDPSEQMLKVARQRFQDHDKIDFENEKADQLSYSPASFGKIICQNSFHFYQYQQQVLDRLFDILKPDGRLYILDWNRSGLFRIVNQIIKWKSTENINTRSLSEVCKMLTDCGFAIQNSDSWNWRYWKLMFIEALKPDNER